MLMWNYCNLEEGKVKLEVGRIDKAKMYKATKICCATNALMWLKLFEEMEIEEFKKYTSLTGDL